MDSMIKEKEAATEKAVQLEAEAKEFEAAGSKFEKEVSDVQAWFLILCHGNFES